MKHPDLTDELRDRLQREIGRKGWELNEKLTQMLAKQDATLATIKFPFMKKPGETPLEALRRYFDLVCEAQRRSRTDDLGICKVCGKPIPVAVLTEIPWTLAHAECDA
jgi:RNA polymerase-binding transcription factor DksA